KEPHVGQVLRQCIRAVRVEDFLRVQYERPKENQSQENDACRRKRAAKHGDKAPCIPRAGRFLRPGCTIEQLLIRNREDQGQGSGTGGSRPVWASQIDRLTTVW